MFYSKRDGVTKSINIIPSSNIGSRPSIPPPKPSAPPAPAKVAKVYEEGRLQLKLPDQDKKPISLETKPDQTLVEVVDMLFAHPDFTDSARLDKKAIKFSSVFPRKTFDDGEMAKSLKVGLMLLAPLVFESFANMLLQNPMCTGFRFVARCCTRSELQVKVVWYAVSVLANVPLAASSISSAKECSFLFTV